ncbi:hypothetical protein NFI96_032960, partial [Prochilodus magdalenae]
KVTPTITSGYEGAVLTGNTVTLYCTLSQSAGWTFYWSHHTQSPEKETTTNIYNISSVRVSDGGQYRCRAGRGNPVYYTHYSDALWVNVTESPKAMVNIKPEKQVFKGEPVTLRCDIQAGGDTEWTYSWYKDDGLYPNRRTQEFPISSVTESNTGKYTCRGERTNDLQKSEISDAVTLTVSDVAQAVLSVSPQSWLTEGDSVTLSCEVTGSSTGWTFSWYRSVPYRQGLKQIRDAHGNVMYDVELLSDSRREAGGSYTLSPAALHHTGVYVCRAERGEPTYQTQYSSPQPLWITGASPPVSLIISPSRSQHFSGHSLSLRCEGQSDSTGWRVRRYTHSGEVSDCSSVTGSTCSISSRYTSHTGVYWCQSESGGGSDPLNITVHSGNVILDSPVHPVTEGDSLTLRCSYRLTKPSNLTADFYRDGSLLQNQTTGEMIIRTVSKSDEGLYHCKHPKKGESPKSWLSVRAAGSGSSGVTVGVAVGLSVTIFLLIILGLVYYCKKRKESPSTGNQQPTNQSQNLSGSGASLSGTTPLQAANINFNTKPKPNLNFNSKPKPASKSNLNFNTKPKPNLNFNSKPKPASKSKLNFNTKPKPNLNFNSKPKPASKSKLNFNTKPKPNLNFNSKPKPASKSNLNFNTKPKPNLNFNSKPKPASKSKLNFNTKPKPNLNFNSKPKPASKSNLNFNTKPKPNLNFNSKPKPASKSNLNFNTKPKPNLNFNSKPKPASKSNLNFNTKPKPNLNFNSKPKPASKSNLNFNTKPKPNLNFNSKPKPASKANLNFNTEPKPNLNFNSKSKPTSKPSLNFNTEPKPNLNFNTKH